MKVILKEDVKSLGRKDQMVEVSDGYARNYLLPRGLAAEASAGNINIMKSKNDAAKARGDKEHREAVELAKKLEGVTVTIRARTGENGKLFGSVTTKEISEKLAADHGLAVDKKKIVHEEPFRHTGDYELEVRLYHGVIAKLKLKLESE